MVFKSSMPDTNIIIKGVYQSLVNDTNGISDNKQVFIDGPTGRTLTYGKFRSSTKRFAAGLIDIGFKRGDVLAIFSTNQVRKIHL
jgi:long-subunit acyl-CoA synthetase (AMP-forming)